MTGYCTLLWTAIIICKRVNCSTMESSTCCLRNLHCLPISARIEYKLLTITYKCLNGEAPDYLSDLLSVIPESRRMLRLSKKYKQLVIPK